MREAGVLLQALGPTETFFPGRKGFCRTPHPHPQHEPDVTRPFRHEPDVTRPFPHKPDVTRPIPHKPDVTRPSPHKPDVTRPFPHKPDVTRPFPHKPDVTRPPAAASGWLSARSSDGGAWPWLAGARPAPWGRE